MVGEFKTFLLKTNALALAIGVIVGIVVALVVFWVAKLFIKTVPAAPPAPTKACPFCREANAPDASKCKFCASETVSYTHLRAHETGRNLVCRLLLEKKKKK